MTPEAALMVAVIEQAITDLDDPNPVIRSDANSFFFGTGAWADIRRLYCDAIGVDSAHVQASLRRAGKAGKPAREPRNVKHTFSTDDLRALIPTEAAFQLADITVPKDVNLTIKQARLAALIKEGFVETIGYRWYALTSLKHPRNLTHKERILSVLDQRPISARELAASLRPRISPVDVAVYCDGLVADGLVEKIGPATYRLRARLIAA